jgi:hypothetical protein
LTNLSDHLIDNTTSRKHGPLGVLSTDDKVILIEWVFGMQECDLSISLHQLKLKVAKLTQTCATPFKNGILRTSWWHWFKQKHLEISIRMAERLDISRAQGITLATYNSFYDNLQSLYNKHNYFPNHKWNCDEIGIQANKQSSA